jgi:hypothetical protein
VRPDFRLTLFLAFLSFAGVVQAQIIVPNFRARGEVPAPLVTQFMDVFRQQLELRTGLSVLPGITTAPPLVGSLDPEVAAAIATLGGGRYSVAGEIIATPAGIRQTSYTVNLLVTDARTRRASDLYSQPLEPRDPTEAVAVLTRSVGAFISPGSAPATGSASLFITSEPRGASIYLNGVNVGTTEGQDRFILLAPGTYEVEIRKKGYIPESDTVTLRMDQIEFMALNLTENRGGSIQVSSVPAAEVYLDGRLVGRTPLTVEAEPGVRTLRLARPGFASETQGVTVRNFFVSRVPEVRLEPGYDNLVYWEPLAGYTVRIDGILRPRNFASSLQPGVHRVLLSRRETNIDFTFTLEERGIFELDLQSHELTPLSEKP